MNHQLPGSALNAFTHMAMHGLANILTDTGAPNVRAWWRDDTEAVATLSWSDGITAAEAVHQHATRHTKPDSWVQASLDHQGRRTAVFSPRIAVPSTRQAWEKLAAARRQVLDDPQRRLTALDHQMIGALGEPNYWHTKPGDPQPDLGAARWEMITRNQGKEFVGQRLAPLARIVAGRTPESVLKGLTGQEVVDELGGNKSDSRTATGFTRPGPVDNALAWCAMWGIATFTLVPQAKSMSQTAGAAPRDRVHPSQMALPIITRPTSTGRWRAIIGSRAFDTVASVRKEIPLPECDAAASWLRSQGVVAIIRFPVEVSSNVSAPERTVLRGSASLLTCHD